jgi:hypothetical protein
MTAVRSIRGQCLQTPATKEYPMQHINTLNFALSIANDMISTRFGQKYGVHTFTAYCNLIDQRSTAHLNAHMAQKVRNSAGLQRLKSRLIIDEAATLIIAIPMNDLHSDTTVWAELEFAQWLDLMEMGADCAWAYSHKGKDRLAGQVRTHAPIASTASNTPVTIARLIVNAKRGQQARTLDRNPLNLRRANLYLVGNPNTVEGAAGRAKTDTVEHLQKQAERRAANAGKNFGMGSDDTTK